MVAYDNNPGTYYACGCWHSGDPHTHKDICETHKKPWQIKYFLNPQKVLYLVRRNPSETLGNGGPSGGDSK